MEINKEETGSILAPLAQLVSKTNFRDIPDMVIHQAELSLVDTLGCIVRGYCTEEGRKAIAVEKSLRGQPESTILVSGERVPAISAARVNGYLGDIMEFNDLISGHAGIGTIPAAMAVGEWQKSSGDAFISAVVLGYEVTSRIYNTFYQWKKDYTDCCSAAVGGPNTFAAAVVAAKLMGLDEPRILEAMLIAGSLLSTCPSESLEAGGSVKPYMFGGWPASVGIYAAICAREGMTGTKTILEGKIGLLKTWAKQIDFRPLSESLGDKKPSDITQVEIKVSPYVIPMVGGPAPANVLASKFSLKYLLSIATMTRSRILPEDTEEDRFQHYLKQGASAFMDRITIHPEESFSHYSYSIVRVLTKGGKEYLEHIKHPKGDPENSMTEEEILCKFRSQVLSVFPGDKAERIISAVFTVRNAKNVLELIPLLVKKAEDSAPRYNNHFS